MPLPRLLGIDSRWGVAGLTLSAGIAAWLEYSMFRRAMHERIGVVPTIPQAGLFASGSRRFSRPRPAFWGAVTCRSTTRC